MKRIVPLLLLVLLIFSVSTSVMAEKVESKYFIMDSEAWDVGYLKTTYTIESFMEEADYYFEVISEFLNVDYNRKIIINIVQHLDKRSRALVNKAGINIDRMSIELNLPPLAHEITHILYYEYSLPSFGEGLAELVVEYFSKVPSTASLGFNIHSLIKLYWDKNFDEEFIDKIIDGGVLYWEMDTKGYIYSHSFVKFIIEQFGINKFKEYFDRGGYVTYESVFGVTREEIKINWINYVNGYEAVEEEEYLSVFFELNQKIIDWLEVNNNNEN